MLTQLSSIYPSKGTLSGLREAREVANGCENRSAREMIGKRSTFAFIVGK